MKQIPISNSSGKETWDVGNRCAKSRRLPQPGARVDGFNDDDDYCQNTLSENVLQAKH